MTESSPRGPFLTTAYRFLSELHYGGPADQDRGGQLRESDAVGVVSAQGTYPDRLAEVASPFRYHSSDAMTFSVHFAVKACWLCGSKASRNTDRLAGVPLRATGIGTSLLVFAPEEVRS